MELIKDQMAVSYQHMCDLPTGNPEDANPLVPLICCDKLALCPSLPIELPFPASALSVLPPLSKCIDTKITPLKYYHSHSPHSGMRDHDHSPLIFSTFFWNHSQRANLDVQMPCSRRGAYASNTTQI